MRRKLGSGLVLAALVGGAVAAAVPPRAAPAPPVARAAACDALGVADSFAVFAHDDFSAAKTNGASMVGRIAAGGDVRLGVTLRLGSGDSAVSPTVIAGRDFIGAGNDDLTGSVLYGGSYTPGEYRVSGTVQKGEPRTEFDDPATGFSFDDQFDKLGLLSDTWFQKSQTAGVSAQDEYGAFTFRGFTTGLNVFHATAEDLKSAAGIKIILDRGPQAGTDAPASVLINISGAVPLTLSPGLYMDLGTANPRRLIWNLPQVTDLQLQNQLGWKGLLLAPNASISGPQGVQLDGQMIAKDVPSAEWTINFGQLETCPPGPTPPPEPEPDTSLDLEPLCVDPFGNLAMRVANVGDRDRTVKWDDVGTDKTAFGTFTAQHGRYEYFNVPDGDADSSIQMTADPLSSDRVVFDEVPGTDHRCAGRITITKQVFGTAAPAGPWTIALTGVNPNGGVKTRTRRFGAGESIEFDALGGFQPGPADFGTSVGGIPYTISEPNPPGDAIVEISANPVHILGAGDPEHEQNEPVTVTNTYPDTPGGGGGPEPPVEPGQPTLPPGAPEPLPGPEVDGGQPGAPHPDLVVTHTITPDRVRVGDTIRTVTRVRNAGPVPASGAVLRELPQYRALRANRVARVRSISTSVGRCTSRRPVRCDLGTLAPGAQAVIRSRTRMLVAADLESVVLASSRTPESNTTNNTGLASVLVTERSPHLRVAISAPPSGRVGVGLQYTVRVTGTGKHGARFVRLCAPRAATLTEVRADGTFGVRGARCRDIRSLPRGRTVSFVVSGVPAAAGRLHLRARATAVNLADADRATAQVPITGGACLSGVRRLRC